MSDQTGQLPLATSTWSAEELDAINEVIASDRYTLGDRVGQFEEAFAASVGSRFAVMVNSGSSANLLAVATAVLDDSIDLNRGDEVLVTAVSWATTYYPLMQYGLRPVLVDIDPETLNMDVDKALLACTARTKAVFAVNLLGNPNDFAAVQALCDAKGLLLLEDNCEAMGATFEGQPCGTFGTMGTFSTYFSHHISTMEGGLVVTDSVRHRDMLLSLRSHGWTRGLSPDSHLRSQPVDDFQDLFHFVLPGYNVRPLELSGAIGLRQLDKLPALIRGRRQNAHVYKELLSGLPGVRLQSEVGASSWFGFSIVLEEALSELRPVLVSRLRAAGVAVRPIVAGNFARNPVMRHADVRVAGPLTHADEIHESGLFIGNHHYAIDDALYAVRDILCGLGETATTPIPSPRRGLRAHLAAL